MKKIFLLFSLMWLPSEKSYGGFFDGISTAFKYTTNLISTRGKGCARCGTPYNVWCMDKNGRNVILYNEPIESCFGITTGGCRPRNDVLDKARKYCKTVGLMLNEEKAGDEEKKHGVGYSQFTSIHEAANKTIDTVDKAVETLTPVATLTAGVVGGSLAAPTGQGGQIIGAAINSATVMRDQTMRKTEVNQQRQWLDSSKHKNQDVGDYLGEPTELNSQVSFPQQYVYSNYDTQNLPPYYGDSQYYSLPEYQKNPYTQNPQHLQYQGVSKTELKSQAKALDSTKYKKKDAGNDLVDSRGPIAKVTLTQKDYSPKDTVKTFSPQYQKNPYTQNPQHLQYQGVSKTELKSQAKALDSTKYKKKDAGNDLVDSRGPIAKVTLTQKDYFPKDTVKTFSPQYQKNPYTQNPQQVQYQGGPQSQNLAQH